MHRAADEMEFERAAELRDKVLLLKDMDLGLKPASRSVLETGVPREEGPGTAGGRLRGRRRTASADRAQPQSGWRAAGRGRKRR